MGVITVESDHDDTHIIIRVGDSGNGIPEKARTRIFDPFFTTKEVGKGTGQGLAIAHNVVVERHNGALTFESEEGKGTVFTIRLPKSQPVTESLDKAA
jgi:signal transduction histidine kinase